MRVPSIKCGREMTGGEMSDLSAFKLREFGNFGRAYFLRERATRSEAAAGGDVNRRGDVAC